MRFQVPINSTFSQKAVFLNSEFLGDSLIPYNIVCIRNPLLIIIRFLYSRLSQKRAYQSKRLLLFFFLLQNRG